MNFKDLPALKAPLEGGLYGGIHTRSDGANFAVAYLNEARPKKDMNHAAARKWAKSQGGQLALPAVLLMLRANLGDLLPQELVWSDEEYGSASAWVCNLNGGYVTCSDRSSELGAVAVRLIPLTL